jgi:hypothetical protein
MQSIPSKELTVRALLYAARQAAESSSATHPEDVAVAMVNTIEQVSPLLLWLNEEGYLK